MGMEWKPIESAPRDGTPVWMADSEVWQRGYFNGKSWCSTARQCLLWESPRWWLPVGTPLPLPPLPPPPEPT